ncbi:MAG: FHA domain-containing protein [Polyangiaceae bacterium]
MSLWDRLRGVGAGGGRERAAQKLERDGDLGGAVEAYLDAELPLEAARVLLLRADAESSPERRMAWFEQAAKVAPDSAIGKRARGRRAMLALEVLRARGEAPKSEICALAKELEDAGEGRAAADAYALVGDSEGEVRALALAGAIDELEQRMSAEAASSRAESERAMGIRRMEDLDRACERRAALELAEKLGGGSGEGADRVTDLSRVIRQRLVRGPLCDLTIAGEKLRVAFGDELTIGRGEGTIVIGAPGLSRRHLVVRRAASADGARVIVVEDANTRNGTFLRGARLAGPIEIGEGLSLSLGGSIPCEVMPHRLGALVSVGGTSYLAPLGPLDVDKRHISLEGAGGDERSFVVLETAPDAPAFAGVLQLAPKVELALGDSISFVRGGPNEIVVGHGGAAR